MTGFKGMGRIRSLWQQTTKRTRELYSQHLTGKKLSELQFISKMPKVASALEKAPIVNKRTTWAATGAAVVLALGTFLVVQQVQHIKEIRHEQYVLENTVTYYQVYQDGKPVGTVSSPDDVAKLVQEQKDKLIENHPGLTMVLDTGELTYETESAFMGVPETEATLSKLTGLFSSHAEGVAVVVNGEVAGIVKDQQTADQILRRVQLNYAPEAALSQKGLSGTKVLSFDKDQEESTTAQAEAVMEQPRKLPTATEIAENGTAIIDKKVTQVAFEEEVEIKEANASPDELLDAEEIYQKLIVGSTKPTQYVVVQGDCVSCIATKYDVTSQFIRDNNPWIVDDKLQIGDVIDLTVQQPDLTVNVTEQLVELQSISPAVEVQKDDTMLKGESKVLSEGTSGLKQVTYTVLKRNGMKISQEVVEEEVLEEASPKIVIEGSKVITGLGSGSFSWPVSGAKVTSNYGKRWGRLHSGMDIVGNSTIKASDTGKVIFSGTKSGLGKTIIIDHKNGFKTVYGHMKSLSVESGQIVEKGQAIGIMGNTGNTVGRTGVHLHFEIHKNDATQNPSSYL